MDGDQSKGQAGAADAEAVKATIATWSRALVDGEFETWIGDWTEDALLMPPGHAALKGRDQILSFIRDNFADVGTFAFSDWRIEAEGDLAVAVNHVRWGETSYKQMIALRRRDGAWKIQLVMFNEGVA